MQINGLMNVLMSLPSAAANGLLQGSDMTAADGQTLGGTALSGNGDQQFASLLNVGQPLDLNIINGKTPLLTQESALANENAASTITQPGDAELLTPANSIAIPVIPTFIDLPPKTEVVLTKDYVLAGNAASKQLIWQNELRNAKSAAGAQASEIANDQEQYSISKPNTKTEDKLLKPEDGKISLASLDTSATNSVDQDEFAAAVARLAQDKQKPVTKSELNIQPKITAENNVELETKTAMNEKAAAAIDASKQPQEVAAKISAKILEIREEKLKPETEADQITTRLQDLDAQLRSRDFNLIKTARETLANTPAQQIQVQISQALKNGTDNIKVHLYPEELGAVDVDLEIDNKGNTQIRIMAERQETLDLLRRDSLQLTKSLADAGLNADANSLQFSLRGDSQNERNFGSNNSNGNDGYNNKQLASAVNDNYSRFTRISEQELKLSIANKSLNILV